MKLENPLRIQRVQVQAPPQRNNDGNGQQRNGQQRNGRSSPARNASSRPQGSPMGGLGGGGANDGELNRESFRNNGNGRDIISTFYLLRYDCCISCTDGVMY